MKTNFRKPSAPFVSILLLSSLILYCLFWTRGLQQQYILNRQLIEALRKTDTKQAIVLVNRGADPNTRLKTSSLSDQLNHLFHPSALSRSDSPTVLMVACGAVWFDEHKHVVLVTAADPLKTQLTQAMLLHGADVNAQDNMGWTALYYAADGSNKQVINQLLIYGANPNSTVSNGFTLITIAEMNHRHDIADILRKYRKRP